MSIIYVGDIHGKIEPLSRIDNWAYQNGIETVVQVGDFGAFWPGEGCPIRHYFWKRNEKKRPGPRWIVSPGNHDNWDLFDRLRNQAGLLNGGVLADLTEMAPDVFYAARGSQLVIDGKRHLMFGGATSTDRHLRLEGRDWWAREQPSTAEFDRFFDGLESGKPDVVVTHDSPTRVNMYRDSRDTDPVVRGLESALALSEHKPGHWFFGHHHRLERWDVDETTFGCCGLHGEFWLLDETGIRKGSVAEGRTKFMRGLF